MMYVFYFSNTALNTSPFFLIFVIINSAFSMRIDNQPHVRENYNRRMQPAHGLRCRINENLRKNIPIVTIAENDILKQLVRSEDSKLNNTKTCSVSLLEKKEAPSIPNYSGKEAKWPQFSSSIAESMGVSAGGEWQPYDCKSPFLVAIIIPIRNREDNLRNFLLHIHPFLQKQNIHYKIYVIEQTPGLPFNKGAMFNAGFMEAMKDKSFPCIILHDVDLLPLHLKNIYACSTRPRHMAVILRNKIRIKIMPAQYYNVFGGGVAILSDHYQLSNGFSNRFWRWGGEDDDFFNRVRSGGLQIIRFDYSISTYYPLFHKQSERNPKSGNTLRKGLCFLHEGLNTVEYKVIHRFDEKLCTRIVISL